MFFPCEQQGQALFYLRRPGAGGVPNEEKTESAFKTHPAAAMAMVKRSLVRPYARRRVRAAQTEF